METVEVSNLDAKLGFGGEDDRYYKGFFTLKHLEKSRNEAMGWWQEFKQNPTISINDYETKLLACFGFSPFYKGYETISLNKFAEMCKFPDSQLRQLQQSIMARARVVEPILSDFGLEPMIHKYNYYVGRELRFAYEVVPVSLADENDLTKNLKREEYIDMLNKFSDAIAPFNEQNNGLIVTA